MPISHFDRPKKSVRWAREALNEVNAELIEFFAFKVRPPFAEPTAPYRKIVDIEPETRNEIHKLRITRPLPEAIERRTFEALQNLRNSFDQTVYAACGAIEKIPRKGNLHFPWCTTPNDLTARLNKGPIPSEFWDIITGEQPYFAGNGYSGGNDTIRELAKLANGKHTFGLCVSSASSIVKPPSAMTRLPWYETSTTSWRPVKNEIFLAKVPPGSHVNDDYEVNIHVAFDEPMTLRNVPAFTILNEFADRAERFTKLMESECVTILK